MIKVCYNRNYMYVNDILKGICFIALTCLSFNANATGYGFYTTALHSGNADWSNGNSTSDTGYDRREFGLMLDTAVAEDKLYNYRLQVAYVEASYDGAEFTGSTITNTFGFGLVRNTDMRIWIGPQIGHKRTDNKFSQSISGFEYGAAVGINYHINPTLSFTGESGIRYGNSYAYDKQDVNTDQVGESAFFINIGLLYRFNDNF